MNRFFSLLFVLLACAGSIRATEYDVNSNEDMDNVPWATLAPGDIVNIHTKHDADGAPDAYPAMLVLTASGTEENPITIRGVGDSNDNLPSIGQFDMYTLSGMDYDQAGRGIWKIGSSNSPECKFSDGCVPKHIRIENLIFLWAKERTEYINKDNEQVYFEAGASGFYVECGQNIVFEGCTFLSNDIGLFVGSSDECQSSDITVRNSILYGNGGDEDNLHNAVSEANGMVYEFNYFGRMTSSSAGSSLKDRSTGLVLRYNYIRTEDTRTFDMVDSTLWVNEPSSNDTFIYGNIIATFPGDNDDDTVRTPMMRYGGDTGNTTYYRGGMMYVYYNTIVTTRTTPVAVFEVNNPDVNVSMGGNIIASDSEEITMIIGNAEVVESYDMRPKNIKGRIGFGTSITIGTFNENGDGHVNDTIASSSASRFDATLKSDSAAIGGASELVMPDEMAEISQQLYYPIRWVVEADERSSLVDNGALCYDCNWSGDSGSAAVVGASAAAMLAALLCALL